MPNWLLPILIKLLAEYLTPESVKGLEAHLLNIVKNAVKGNPTEVEILTLLAGALGVKMD